MVVPDDLFGVIPLWVAVYALGALGFGLQGLALFRRFLMPILQGTRDERRFDQPLKRFWGMILVVFGQRRVLMSVSFGWRDLAGLGHSIIFWGFISMVVSYILFIFLDSIDPNISQFLLTPDGLKVFFSYLDILSVVVIAMLIWAVARRWVVTPPRLVTLRSKDAATILVAIAGLMVLHQLTEIMHVAAVLEAEETGRTIQHLEGVRASGFSTTTPIAGNIGEALFKAGTSFSVANTLHGVFWWLHYLLVLSFGVYIAFSKHMHVVASPFNAFFRSLKPRGALIPIPNMEEAETWGATRPQELSWKQLLDGFACAVCGRCTDNCPANISGKPLSPMDLIEHVKDNLMEIAPGLEKAKDTAAKETAADAFPLYNKQFTEEWVWDCVSCGACEQECPVMVEHLDTIVDLRRNLVMTQAKMPAGAEQTLRSLETRGHPWRGSQATRVDWTKDLPVKIISESGDDGESIDVLFWVGCTSALEDRSQSVARAMARVLDRAGVKYAILGMEEACNGDPARRIGHEYLFELLARQTIDMLNRYKIKKILTTCPHCFNTMKNEYPDLGGKFEVEHYATFVKRLLDDGRLKLGKPLDLKVTYHDSCYLGRYNDVYDEPRDVLRTIPGVELQEIPLRNRERSFCCGAGGGHMWIEETSGRRINHIRTEQALATNPQKIAVSCPFCLQMFKEGLESAGEKDNVEAVDVIELVADAMDD